MWSWLRWRRNTFPQSARQQRHPGLNQASDIYSIVTDSRVPDSGHSAIHCGERSILADFRITVAKQLAVLHHFGNLRGHHALPRGVILLDAFQYVAREDVQDAVIEVAELLDSAPFDEVPEEMVECPRYCNVVHSLEQARSVVPQGIDIEPQIFGEELSESFEDAAFQIRVVLLVKKVEDVGHAQGHGNWLGGVSGEIGCQPIVFEVV